MISTRVRLCSLLLLPWLAGCNPAKPQFTCDPLCGPGTRCDEVSLTCVPAGGEDGGANADLASGGCNPKCSGLTPLCNAAKKCVACLADTDCPMNTFCKVISDSVASCVSGCNDDKRCGGGKCCGNRCVDVSADASNCGACGAVCSGAHSVAACAAGKCVPGKCAAGWGDCNKDAKDGCETNLHTDAAHCTACGNACNIMNAINACADGCYITACKFGFDDCNQDPMDGCETSVLMDGLNCGACGKSCAKLPHATAGCMNGACALGACEAGWTDCDRDPKNGCESNTAYDSNNCGRCGNVCPMNAPSCSDSKCGQGQTFGPMHTFAGMTTDHYITQGCCSVNCMDNPDVNADYFCKHFYRNACIVKPGYVKHTTPMPTYPKMHKNGGCTGNGSDVPNTTCDAGPCKIGNWNESTTGLANLICFCP